MHGLRVFVLSGRQCGPVLCVCWRRPSNRRRRAGDGFRDAIQHAGVRRFRPIVLTSLTTFVGLTPMLLEKSLQARFLIPMAISLGFGVLFATFITLVLVPVSYMVLEDLKRSFGHGAAAPPARRTA